MDANWVQMTLDSWICHGCPKKCFVDNIEQPPVGCQSEPEQKRKKAKRWKHEEEHS